MSASKLIQSLFKCRWVSLRLSRTFSHCEDEPEHKTDKNSRRIRRRRRRRRTRTTSKSNKEFDVPGLSKEVVKVGSNVGPGACLEGDYKQAHYYSFHKYSFYNAIEELKKYRNPLPDSHIVYPKQHYPFY